MFKRSLQNTLNTWANSQARKPLVLRGARQVGKTTVVTEFAAQYDQFLSLNLEKKADRDLFEQNHSTDALRAAIYFHKNQSINPKAKTLLFIDEIQYASQAPPTLRYFYEEYPELHVIAAGSLLETLIDRQISFPVGRVEYQWMYPLSFFEYLAASQQIEALNMLETKPCPSFAHEKLLKLFCEYTFIGGMPEAISAYLTNRDILAVNKVYDNLLTAYMDDVEKYAPNRTMANVIRHAIQHAPLEAGGRIKFQGFGQSNYKSREMGEALRLLEKAMLIQLVYPTVDTIPPASCDHKKSPRLQFLDTGMMNFAAGLQQHYFNVDDLNTLYRGQVSENIVGQELLANHIVFNQQLKFWVREKKQSNAEVDFVMPFDKYLIPIEVKSGKTGTLKSLLQFMESTDHTWAVRLYGGQLQKDILHTPSGKAFYLLSLPYYLIAQLKDYVGLLMEGKL